MYNDLLRSQTESSFFFSIAVKKQNAKLYRLYLAIHGSENYLSEVKKLSANWQVTLELKSEWDID